MAEKKEMFKNGVLYNTTPPKFTYTYILALLFSSEAN
jgi:hypothetical protein